MDVPLTVKLAITYLKNDLLFQVLLQSTQESVLLSRSLESTLTKLGGSVDPLQLDLFSGLSGSVNVQGLSQGDDSLLGTWNRTLDQDEVVLDVTVSDETTHWVDGLSGSVELGGTTGLVIGLTNSVDLVVDGGSVVVTVLTGSGNSPVNVSWMPSTDTSNLSQTSVGLSRQLLGTPSVGDTLETVTLGDSNGIDHLVLLENRVNRDGLLKVLSGPVDLVGDRATVNADFGQVSLLAGQWGLLDLGVSQNSDNRSVLLDSGQLSLDLSGVLGVLSRVLGESLFLGLVPVLVESSSDFLGQVLSPNGGQRSQASWGLDVTDNTNNNQRRSVNNGSSLNDLTLVHLGTRTVQVSDDGGHTSLVTQESSQSNRLRLVIFRERLNSSSLSGSSLSWEETQGTVTWCFVLSVRHSY